MLYDRSPILDVQLETSGGCIVASILLGLVYNLEAPRRRSTTHVETKDWGQNLLHMRRGESSSPHLVVQKWRIEHYRGIDKQVDEIRIIVHASLQVDLRFFA